ncbi:molybdopterin cofactor-binding domain-containing protein [Elstera litoralis]|uniref:molybdopterin cofactor-binding domain-containing protein n=1 Tax=Elstera litoralis TaxID=552518 RepID=UPI000698523F
MSALEVMRGSERFLTIDAAGRVTAFNGHVDLGTGIRTALAQIVAEELSIPFDRVEMVLGSTRTGPDQGATIASETIQVSAIPLRQAAATARAFLLGLAAEHLGVPTADLTVVDGVVQSTQDRNLFVSYPALLAGQSVRLDLDPHAP